MVLNELTLYRPKAAGRQGRYMCFGEAKKADPIPGRPGRVFLIDFDHPTITTTAFRADEIEPIQ